MNNEILKIIDPYKKFYFKSFYLISTVLLFNTKEEVLLQLRDDKPDIINPNMWGPLGGHCDDGETPYDCAKRECYEETGYVCKNLNWDNNYIFPYRDNERHVVCFFWANYDNFQKINCYEGQKIVFLSINSLKNYNISKKNISIIEHIKNSKKND